jgi:uncharacterized protein YecT (DUF1311 family)
LFLVAASHALAVGLSGSPPEAELCDGSQADRRICLSRLAETSEADLRSAEAAMETSLSAWDEEPMPVAAASARFARSRAAFSHYRQAQCDFNASLGGGAIGSALEMRRLMCVIELTRRRAGELRELAVRLPRK